MARMSDTWELGHPYQQFVGRWSRRVALEPAQGG